MFGGEQKIPLGLYVGNNTTTTVPWKSIEVTLCSVPNVPNSLKNLQEKWGIELY